jgi:hypothetical protein
MTGEDERRWRELCEAASKAEDSERLLDRQINQLLSGKEDRLRTKLPRQGSAA